VSKAKAIRVLIVDDHTVVRSGLRLLLDAEPDIEVVAEAGDVREAEFEARAAQAGVVPRVVGMPGGGGMSGVALL
jgi:DNA-binding NarL/FixJ family response regulator